MFISLSVLGFALLGVLGWRLEQARRYQAMTTLAAKKKLLGTD